MRGIKPAGHNKMTPILVQDGLFDTERIARRFAEHASDIEPELSSFALEKIRAYR